MKSSGYPDTNFLSGTTIFVVDWHNVKHLSA